VQPSAWLSDTVTSRTVVWPLPRPTTTAASSFDGKNACGHAILLAPNFVNHSRVRCSRLGGRRIVFQPYTQQQLVQIVQTRLDGLDVFEPSAIRFAAAKVGDSPLRSAVHTGA